MTAVITVRMDPKAAKENKMNKLGLMFLLCTGATLIAAPKPTSADIEALETVLGAVRNGIEKVEGGYEQLSKLKNDITSAATGVQGAIEDTKEDVQNIKDKASDIEGTAADLASGGKVELNLLNKNPDFIKDVNNAEETISELSENYNAKMGTGDSVNAEAAQREKMNAIQRENLANLYAEAFTTRTLLAKERARDPKKLDMENTRKIIKATNDITLEMARRIRNIMKLETANSELQTTQKALVYSTVSSSDEKEEKSE